MGDSRKLLIVDDDEVTRKLLLEVFSRQKYTVLTASSAAEAIELVRMQAPSVVLSDIRMADSLVVDSCSVGLAGGDGISLLKQIKSFDSNVVVILMTGFGSMDGALEALQFGAFDYISKPFKIDDVRNLVSRGFQHRDALVSDSQRSKVLAEAPQMKPGVLIGKSAKSVELYKAIARAALSEANVLILGESGTGKIQAAKTIHENSFRKNSKAVRWLIPEGELRQIEEWDVVKVQAKDSTLFLEEVNRLMPAAQARIMSSLSESRELGLKLRLICTSNEELEPRVKDGTFREDFYYFINVIKMSIPPLRERLEDLPDLVGHFLALASERNQKLVSHVSDEAFRIFRRYQWPGNVRELEKTMESVVAMARAQIIYPEDLPTELLKNSNNPSHVVNAAMMEAVGPSAVVESPSLEDMEKGHILRVLQDVGFNKSKAAEVLGIDRATLYRKASRYGIDLKNK